MHILKSPSFGFAVRVSGIKVAKTSRSPRQNAIAYLKKNHDLFGLSSDLLGLCFDRQCPTPLGQHIFFQQQHDGISIGTAWLRVDLDPELNVIGAYNKMFPSGFIRRALGRDRVKIMTTPEAACRLAQQSYKQPSDTHLLSAPTISIRPRGPSLVTAWKVELTNRARSEPFSHSVHYVDATSPRWLFQRQSSFRATEASVFQPNPIVALNRPDLGISGTIPEIAYQRVQLLGLQNSGHLDGEFVTTDRSLSPRISVSEGLLQQRRGTRGFLEIMAYYNIDSIQRYLQSLGYTRAHARQVHVNIAATSGQSSEYLPALDEIQLAIGGVPDGEDAEIIAHEYAHAVHSDIYPTFGTDSLSINLAEGFADYLAVSFFAGRKSAALLPCFASWDARADQPTATPPALRRLDRPTRFSQLVLNGRNTNATEFWGSCLLNVRQLLGGQVADTCIVGSLFVMERNRQSISYFQAAKGICDAYATGFGRTTLYSELTNLFRDRGIFS